MTSHFSPPASRTVHQRANELLARPHMRLHLILAVLCCLTFWIGSIYMSEITFNAVPWNSLYENQYALYVLLDILYYVLDTLIILLIGLPLLFGCAMIFEGAARGVREPMATLFCAFDSPRHYFRVLGMTLRLLLATALPVLLCVGAVWASILTDTLSALWGIFPSALLFLFAASVVLCRNDAVLTLAYDDPTASVRALFARSHQLTQGRWLALWKFKLSYIGWAVLSVLSLGLVLIFHALPHFSLSYSLLLTSEAGDHTS